MSEPQSIRYLRRQEIDTGKWDNCITRAKNGLVYAYSFYLDTMAANWDALVMDDYAAVMPLPWKKKWGIRYIYHPFLTAQLGIFSAAEGQIPVTHFLAAIPARFRYIDLPLNHSNIPSAHETGLTIRSNYVLSLHLSYDELYNRYSENIQRNIKKAVQAGCRPAQHADPEKVIKLAVGQMKQQGHDPGENLERFRKLLTRLQEKQMVKAYGIESADGTLLASCLFFFSHQRAYYILVGNHPASKNTGASHTLIDSFIRDHAGKKLLLDFEGSDIPGLAQFYSGFGAAHEPYPSLRLNRLPFFLRWLKK